MTSAVELPPSPPPGKNRLTWKKCSLSTIIDESADRHWQTNGQCSKGWGKRSAKEQADRPTWRQQWSQLSRRELGWRWLDRKKGFPVCVLIVINLNSFLHSVERHLCSQAPCNPSWRLLSTPNQPYWSQPAGGAGCAASAAGTAAAICMLHIVSKSKMTSFSFTQWKTKSPNFKSVPTSAPK